MEGEQAPRTGRPAAPSQEGDGKPHARFGRWLPALRIPRPKLRAPRLSLDGLRRRAPRLAGLRLKIPRPSFSMPRLPDLRAQTGARTGARRIGKLNLRRAFPKRETKLGASDRGRSLSELRAALTRVRLSPFALGVGAVVLAVAFVAGMTFYGSRTFSRRAANTRASNEASSLAQHSGTLATGDAFDGYIQILRFADDPVVHAKASKRDARLAALQQLLYLNVNKFASLTIADRAGTVLATTDTSISDGPSGPRGPSGANVSNSPTFAETRANLAPANSDIILTQPGTHGYVEYATGLKDADGTTWGILVGRADPARIWKSALDASVDGSRNVIINNEGRFAAGVPDQLLNLPWRGSPIGDGGVRADIAGVDSICGLAPIGKDTQIDRGLNIASCLPTSVIQAEHGAAMGKQGLVTLTGAVLAIVLAGGALLLVSRGSSGPAAASDEAVALPADEDESTVTAAIEAAEAGAAAELEPEPEPESEIDPEPEPESQVQTEVPAETSPTETQADAPPHEPEVAPVSTVEVVAPGPVAFDALTLIEAYEHRNARLSEHLRESVQAKLLVATTQADEAYKLAKSAPGNAEVAETADKLHAHVMLELERLRDQDLRAIGQELHPGLIRLGLPGALRALRKELDGTIDVTLDVDPTTDSVGGTAGRAAIPPGQRLALYRLAAEATRALAEAGASTCTVALRREGELLVLAVSGATPGEAAATIDRSTFAASALAADAYGGYLSIRRQDDRLTVSIEVPAQPMTELPAVDLAAWERAALEEPGDDAETADDDAPEVPADEQDADAGASSEPAESAGTPDGGEVRHIASIGAELDIVAAMEQLRSESGDAPAVGLALDLPPDPERIGLPQRKTAYELARVTVDALRLAGAQRAAVSLKHGSETLMVSIIAETDGTPFDGAHIKPVEAAIEALGGYVAVSRRDNAVSVTAEIMAPLETTAESAPSVEPLLPSEDAA